MEYISCLSKIFFIFSKNILEPQVILHSYLICFSELLRIHPSPSKYPNIKLVVKSTDGFRILDLSGTILYTCIKYSQSSLELI